jgi:hypothetical protein
MKHLDEFKQAWRVCVVINNGNVNRLYAMYRWESWSYRKNEVVMSLKR